MELFQANVYAHMQSNNLTKELHMKKLLWAVATSFCLTTLCFSYQMTDWQCHQDCTDLGYSFNLCKQRCSYRL